jgi:hypothetical protein
MAVTERGTGGTPDSVREVTRTWRPDTGEDTIYNWPNGTPENIDAKYEALKGDAGLRELTTRRAQGRCTLVAKYARADDEQPESVTTIEELYAFDVVRPIEYAPYFTTAAATKIDDDDIGWVTRVIEEQWNENEITTQGDALGKKNWAAWTDSMKELKYHALHGQPDYLETAYGFRRSRYGVRTSQMQASFDDINKKVAAPTFSTSMGAVVASLPKGEWLKRCPSVRHLGRGRWQVEEEFVYATKVSIIYGGTWGKDN